MDYGNEPEDENEEEDENDYQRRRRRGLARPKGRGRGVGVSAGPVTVRLPREVAQREQVNSCSSPEGSTSSSLSRTGCEEPHLGQ